MGKLVPFDKRLHAARVREPAAGDGKILIFTGVRYERGTTLPDKGNAPGKPGRKRG